MRPASFFSTNRARKSPRALGSWGAPSRPDVPKPVRLSDKFSQPRAISGGVPEPVRLSDRFSASERARGGVPEPVRQDSAATWCQGRRSRTCPTVRQDFARRASAVAFRNLSDCRTGFRGTEAPQPRRSGSNPTVRQVPQASGRQSRRFGTCPTVGQVSRPGWAAGGVPKPVRLSDRFRGLGVDRLSWSRTCPTDLRGGVASAWVFLRLSDCPTGFRRSSPAGLAAASTQRNSCPQTGTRPG